MHNNIPKDEKIANTFLLAIFFGFAGIHSFYNKKIFIGILQLVTFGGFGIWWCIDIILIILEKYKVNNLNLVWGGEDNQFAGFKIRLCAFIIDMIFLKFIFYFISFVIFNVGQVSYFYYIIYSTLLLSSKFKTTIGKYICGLVVKRQNNNNLNFFHALFRQIISLISFIPLCLGYIIIDFNKAKLSLHDYIIKTKVIYRTK
jgi:uncharacterized RDD family membrane protein YckC/TM2 domain-containing membrane protein YozV